MVLDSQEPCRDERCGAKSIIEGNPYQRYGILDSRCQFEMSAGQRSVFGDQSPIQQLDLPPHEFEMVLLSANGGHRVADEGNVALIFCRKCGPYNERIDMDTVENDAGCETLVGKGHADNARLPGAHGRPWIEEGGKSGQPVVVGPSPRVGIRS